MRRSMLVLSLLLLCPAVAWCQDDPDSPVKNLRLTIDPGGHTTIIHGAHFSHDGKRLFTSSFDNTIQVWEIPSGRRLQVIHLPHMIRELHDGRAPIFALSPDDRTLAVIGWWGVPRPGGDFPLFYIDLDSSAVRRGPAAATEFHTLLFSPDGRYLVATGNPQNKNSTQVLVWKVGTGLPPGELIGHEQPVTGLAFSADGQQLLTAALDGTVRTWDLKALKETSSVKLAAIPELAAWSADRKFLATASGGTVDYWSAEGKKLQTFKPEDLGSTLAGAKGTHVTRLAFGPAGRELRVGWDAEMPDRKRTRAGASVLDLDGGKAREVFSQLAPSKFAAPAFSADGKWGALVNYTTISLWPIEDPKKARRLGEAPPPPVRVAWDREGKSVAWVSRDEALPEGPFLYTRALDLVKLEARSNDKGLSGLVGGRTKLDGWTARWVTADKWSFTADGKKEPTITLNLASFTLVPNGKSDPLLAVDVYRGQIKLYDLATGKLIRELGSTLGNSRSMAPSPDGRFVASATNREVIRIFSVAKGKPLLTLYVAGEDWIVWTEEGYYAATPGGERMMGWLAQAPDGKQFPQKLPTFYPAGRFRERMHRPDVIALVLEKEDVEAALKEANKKRKDPRGLTNVGEVLPPSVLRVEVNRKESRDGITATVGAIAEASVDGQPVTAMQLILDGRPAPMKDDVVRFPTPVKRGKPAIGEWTFKVPPGPHRLAVMARSRDSDSFSSEVDLEGPPLPAGVRYRLHTICAGVTRYANHGKGKENDLNLKYAADDARMMDAVLAQACVGRLYKPGQSILLTDRHATREAILDAIKSLGKRTEPGDLVVVYFSGHGEQAEDGNLFLLTHEADRRKPLKETCLAGAALKAELAEVQGKVLLLLDACHASAIGPPQRVASELAILLSQEDCGAAVIAAARSKELALEAVKNRDTGEEIRNGLFTWAMAAALEGKASVDPYDGRVYIHDVYQYVFREVRYHSVGRQFPYMNSPFGSKPLALVAQESKDSSGP